ncbi:hypothetical protein BJ878DRAFT_480322 [Calycina marina]|uniref:2EXR domain-containing protein n=1 Tax=Calycina marina TaxID=1763456 RepID=A0A9P8CF17_9HELO|nr:hypothetical protein BJ878DRAFT_480322 [Calycina marina]
MALSQIRAFLLKSNKTKSNTKTEGDQEHAKSSDALQSFHRFLDLSGELQNKIWESSLPDSRVIRLVKTKDRKCAGLATSRVPQLYACRDSRAIALQHYPLCFGEQLKHPVHFNTEKDWILARERGMLLYLISKDGDSDRSVSAASLEPLTRIAFGDGYGLFGAYVALVKGKMTPEKALYHAARLADDNHARGTYEELAFLIATKQHLQQVANVYQFDVLDYHSYIHTPRRRPNPDHRVCMLDMYSTRNAKGERQSFIDKFRYQGSQLIGLNAPIFKRHKLRHYVKLDDAVAKGAVVEEHLLLGGDGIVDAIAARQRAPLS